MIVGTMLVSGKHYSRMSKKGKVIMKKLYVLLTLGVLACGMTACGGGNDENNAATQQTQQMQTQEAQPGTTTTTTEESPTQENTSTTEAEGEDMNATTVWSEEMTPIRQAVADALGDQYWPNMQVDSETLGMVFGITPDMYEDYMAEMPMISTNVDTLLIIKAKDDKVEAVEEALNTYREAKVADTMQYPTNLGKIQASRIQTFGKYVCFVQLGADNLADEDMTEEESLTKCQEQNDLVLEVIGKNVPQE